MFSSKSDDPDAPAKCPHCSKEIGVEDNTYRFQVVDFTAEDGGNQRKDGKEISNLDIEKLRNEWISPIWGRLA